MAIRQRAVTALPNLIRSLRKEPLLKPPHTVSAALPSLRRAFSLYDQINLIDNVPDDQLRFQGYTDTGFTINGVQYEGSLLCVGNLVLSWKPNKFSDITPHSLSLFQVVRPIPVPVNGDGDTAGHSRTVVISEMRPFTMVVPQAAVTVLVTVTPVLVCGYSEEDKGFHGVGRTMFCGGAMVVDSKLELCGDDGGILLCMSEILIIGCGRNIQHVDPEVRRFIRSTGIKLEVVDSVPAQVPDWNMVFADPTLPLMVDIGCGSGRFLMWHAKRNPKVSNYLGLEIRQKLVTRAELWVKDMTLDNMYYPKLYLDDAVKHLCLFLSMLGNDCHAAMQTFLVCKCHNFFQAAGRIVSRTLACPDPHFKKRHHKRRVLQKPLVGAIVDNLIPGGQLFIQSDVLEVALNMRIQFDEFDALKHTDTLNPAMPCDDEGWLLSNPMGIRTEREIHAEFEGAKMYRRLYQKHT
ncbi:hypothetical protein TanjilG_14259 [Lupinus angustifolius]|uniref:tRNA (guanine(46)-N(7))-methyltransferase n=1 Tax=Lupinus angustifolius TaxID=3871 RepID=A0A1J7GKX1_LUPAN|nr:hypothetical protein TanjilG_14259 [Lupinus angustifolius]